MRMNVVGGSRFHVCNEAELKEFLVWRAFLVCKLHGFGEDARYGSEGLDHGGDGLLV